MRNHQTFNAESSMLSKCSHKLSAVIQIPPILITAAWPFSNYHWQRFLIRLAGFLTSRLSRIKRGTATFRLARNCCGIVIRHCLSLCSSHTTSRVARSKWKLESCHLRQIRGMVLKYYSWLVSRQPKTSLLSGCMFFKFTWSFFLSMYYLKWVWDLTL